MSERAHAITALTASTVAWGVCFACWVLNAALVTLLAVSGAYPIDETQIGWLLAAPIVTGALSRVPLGVLTDLWGGRRVFAALMLTSAVPMALLSFADGFGGFLVASLGFGLAGGSFAVGVGYVSAWFPGSRQGMALGVFGVGCAGAALTTVVVPRLFHWVTDGGAALDGWRLVPRIYAAALVITALGFYLLTRERRGPDAGRRSLGARLQPLGDVVVWRLGFYYSLVFGAFVALAQWIVPYGVQVYQLPVAQAGMLAAAFSLPAGVVRAGGGWLSDRYGARSVMYGVFGASVIVCLVLSVPRMEIVSPGEGVAARRHGVVTSASTEAVVVDREVYRLSPRPVGEATEAGRVLPRVARWQEPAVTPGETVVKGQLLARGVTRLGYPAHVGLFAGLVFLFGLISGVGSAAVYKLIPEQFPGAVGLVGGTIGLIGALGGFLYPIAFGYLLRWTGLWTSSWMLLTLMSLACLVGLHRVVRRLMREEVPELVRLIERRPAAALRHAVPLLTGGQAMTVEALLKSIPFFADLTAEQLASLARIGKRVSAGPDERVVREGDPGDSLYVILEGRALVSRADEAGQAVELADLGDGDFFGELALIDGQPRSATVATRTPCVFFVIERREFLTLLSKSTGLLASFLVGLSTRIRHTDEQFLQLALKKERLRGQMEIERHRSLAQMVAGVAHEVNTPLGIVNHAASVITDRLPPDRLAALARDEEARGLLEDVAEAARLIQANAARADALIRSFKNLSVRQVTDRKETVDLAELTREVVGLYRLKARQSGLAIEVSDRLGAGGAEWVGYPGHYSQVLLNLISNVDRYAYPDGTGGKVEIVLSAVRADGQAPRFEVTVRDFGRGIPLEDLDRVFDPFFTTGRDRGGTGLGLAIVHNLVTAALGGTIRIESAPDRGTAVMMSLPATVSGEGNATGA